MIANKMFGESGEEGNIVLARERKPAIIIVTAVHATEPEKLATRELSAFLTRVTGAPFMVVPEAAFSGVENGIYVGWTKYAEKNGIEPTNLGEEEWIIRTVGKNLILTGGRPRGTLYAVYEFLENQIGCHWLDSNTEIVPDKATLTIDNLNIQVQASISLREIYGMKGNSKMADDLRGKHEAFLIRNKENPIQPHVARKRILSGTYPMIGSPGLPHTFSYYVNAKDWFESHPEYFSLNAKGKRIPAYNDRGPGQLCLTNPGVRRLTLESLKKFIVKDRAEAARKDWPPPKIYDISQNDKRWRHCQCANCQAIVKREGGESGPLIEFVNTIAEGVETKYPDIFIHTLAYNQTKRPPKNFKPRRNVIVTWCCSYTYSDILRPLRHPANSDSYESFKGWAEITPHLGVWDYWIPFSRYHFPTPYCIIQAIGQDIKLFADAHVESMFVESEEWREIGGQNFIDLKYWLAYKLMVNPKQEIESLIQTFMDGYYGAASPKMKDYLTYLERRIANDDRTQNKGPTWSLSLLWFAPYKLNYLDLDFFVTAEKLFDEAEALVKPGSLEDLHVRKERLVVDGALLYLWPWLDHQLAPDVKMPFNHENVIRRFETYWQDRLKDYSPKVQKSFKERISKLVATFRNPELPEQFRNLPPRKVADFNWLTFDTTSISGLPNVVSDQYAAGGMAQLFSGTKEDHEKPLTFGVGGSPGPITITLNPEEVPQDEQYHLFKIGRVNVKKSTVVWAQDRRDLEVKLDWPGIGEAKDPLGNNWDVYISLKVEGPAYVKGSTGKNGIWMDRVLLVKSQKPMEQ